MLVAFSKDIGVEGRLAFRGICDDSIVSSKAPIMKLRNAYEGGLDGSIYFLNHSDDENLKWVRTAKKNWKANLRCLQSCYQTNSVKRRTVVFELR